VIEARAGDNLLFELETGEPKNQMAVFASLKVDSSELTKAKYTITGNKVIAQYKVISEDLKDLNVIFNGELVMRYRLKIKK
jgi:hypothetical protein